MIIVLTFLAVGFSLPEGYPLKINLGKFQIDQVLNPLAIDLNIGSLKIQKKPKTVLGLDLAGGARIVYEADVENIPSEDRKTALDAARNVIERRVNLFGVAEPVVQTSKVGSSERIIVELPGVTDVEAAKTLIGKTAQLDFREFESEDATASAGFFPTTEMTKETGLTGKDLKKAGVTFNQNSGQPEVALEFTAEGAKLFEQITERNAQKPLALDKL